MQITTKERVMGYDIRYFDNNIDKYLIRLSEYKNIEKCCSYDRSIWPSRFICADNEQNDLLKIENTNYRQVLNIVDGKYVVPWEYSYHFMWINLWDNLGNMMTRYHMLNNKDHVIAITFQIIIEPKITCYGKDIFGDQIPDIYHLKESEITPSVLKKDEWEFLGYDTGESQGYSFLNYAYDAIVNQPNLKEEIFKSEGYSIGDNRNKFGLHDNIETAVYECILLNSYRDDCPDFVFGIYEAIEPSRLSYI